MEIRGELVPDPRAFRWKPRVMDEPYFFFFFFL